MIEVYLSPLERGSSDANYLKMELCMNSKAFVRLFLVDVSNKGTMKH